MSINIRDAGFLCFLVLGVGSTLLASSTGVLAVGGTEQVTASGVWDTGTVSIWIKYPQESEPCDAGEHFKNFLQNERE